MIRTLPEIERPFLLGLAGLRVIAILLVAFSATSALGIASPQKSTKEIYQSSVGSIVLVVSLDESGAPLGMGTGFYFREQLVATNEHVVNGADSILIRSIGAEKSVKATRVRSFSESLDIALIEVPSKGKPLPTGTKGRDSIGEKVVAIGNPRGLQGSVSAGIISGVRAFGDETIYQITAPISPGSSGGPVFDSSGVVFGLATFTLGDSQNLNFAVPAAALSTLENKRNGWDPKGQGVPIKQRDNAGIDLVLFEKKGPSFKESLSLRNTTRRTIESLTAVLVYKTMDGTPFHFRPIRVEGRIPPGMAKLSTSRSFDQEQSFAFHKDLSATQLRMSRYRPFDVEVRVLSYDIVESPAEELLDELIR